MSCVRYIVRGRVQGVGFRAYVLRQANALALRGFVRNLTDGGVECIACGEAEALARLAQHLRQGPPHARVESLSEDAVPPPTYAAFEVR